jgi:hypothetical protein
MFIPLSKISKYILIICFIFVTFVTSTNYPKVNALDYVMPDNAGNVNVSQPKTNLTVGGNQVDISSSVSKDLIASGGNVSITGDIERNLIVAGGNLNVQSKKIGASVRVLGGNINLKNTVIEEDLVVVAGTLILSNVEVKGGIYFIGGNLDITNSTFLGSANIRYGTYKGDKLENMVFGNLDVVQNPKLKDKDQSQYEQNRKNSIWNIFWSGQLSVLYGLILLLIFLSSKKALNRFEDINWNSKFWMDMLIGFAFLVVTPAVFLFSILLLGFTFTGSLLTLVYSLFFLSSVFLPFYLAKLIINTTKRKANVTVTSLLIWFVLLVDSMLSNIFPILWIIGFLAFLVNLSAFGYIINHIIVAINKYFDPKNEPKKVEVVELTEP